MIYYFLKESGHELPGLNQETIILTKKKMSLFHTTSYIEKKKMKHVKFQPKQSELERNKVSGKGKILW